MGDGLAKNRPSAEEETTLQPGNTCRASNALDRTRAFKHEIDIALRTRIDTSATSARGNLKPRTEKKRDVTRFKINVTCTYDTVIKGKNIKKNQIISQIT